MKIEVNPSSLISREAALSVFRRELKTIVRNDVALSLIGEQLVMMLVELAKNTLDHSEGSGLLTLPEKGIGSSYTIIYEDTGQAFDWSECSRMGLSSKKENGINLGLGLGLVIQGASTLGLQLSITRHLETTQFKFNLT